MNAAKGPFSPSGLFFCARSVRRARLIIIIFYVAYAPKHIRMLRLNLNSTYMISLKHPSGRNCFYYAHVDGYSYFPVTFSLLLLRINVALETFMDVEMSLCPVAPKGH
jgi:hypothetical protein